MNLIKPVINKQKNIPSDIWNIIKNYLYFEINDTNIKIAVGMWRENKNKALILYGNISYWNTSAVTDMSKLFFDYNDFNDDITNWNVANVNYMTGVFKNAKSFNQPINGWDVSGVKNMYGMFCGAESFNQEIYNWNVQSVRDKETLFYGARSFKQKKPIFSSQCWSGMW
jgi:hypothetical protein